MRLFFCVDDFLKIQSARVDITNFTVFVGDNNSGKTKLMELIYGVLAKLAFICPRIDSDISDNKIELRLDEIKQIVEFANKHLKEHKEEIIRSIFNKDIPINKMSIEVEDIDFWYEIIFLTKSNLNTLFEMELFQEERIQRVVQQIDNFNQVVILKRKLEDNSIVDKWMSGFSSDIPLTFMEPIVMGEVLGTILGLQPTLGEDLLFLPASRMGLMMLYKEYFGAESEDKIKMIREKNLQRNQMTKPVMDFLSFLLKYSYSDYWAKKNAEIIEFINESLIDGKLNEEGEITTYVPKNENVEVPLFLSSSMINELDPIVKMLTDKMRYGFLFYDEVETSLHPKKQLELVKLLNRLNNNGLKILMSTHSDSFVTKWNNLLLMSYSEKRMVKQLSLCDGRIKVTEADLLRSNNVHVYQFTNMGNGKSQVKELEFRKVPYTGYTFELFEDSANYLYEESKVALGIEEC